MLFFQLNYKWDGVARTADERQEKSRAETFADYLEAIDAAQVKADEIGDVCLIYSPSQKINLISISPQA